MFGLPGPTLRDEDVSLFKETRAAGLIVYRRNFDSPAGLLRLLGSLEGALGRRLLVATDHRSEEHTSELQSQSNLVCRLLLEKKKKNILPIKPTYCTTPPSPSLHHQ